MHLLFSYITACLCVVLSESQHSLIHVPDFSTWYLGHKCYLGTMQQRNEHSKCELPHIYKHFYFKGYFSVIYPKSTEKQKKAGKGKYSICWFIHQIPIIDRLGQVKARTQKLNQGLPQVWEQLNYWIHHLLHLRVSMVRKLESGAELELRPGNET